MSKVLSVCAGVERRFDTNRKKRQPVRVAFEDTLRLRQHLTMGKTVQETLANPFAQHSSELHVLSRGEEEACYKDMKARALQHCQLPVKGTPLQSLPFSSSQRRL